MPVTTSKAQHAKRAQIMDGARQAFIDLGYEGASTNEIVRRAGISKGTLYNYFADKEALFAAFIEEECATHADLVTSGDPDADDIVAELQRMALELVKLLVDSSIHDIYRIAIAESGRFPRLAQTFYKSGPERGAKKLAQFFAEAAANGKLNIDDPMRAAIRFRTLCEGDLFYRRLCRMQDHFSATEMRKEAENIVEMFLDSYGIE